MNKRFKIEVTQEDINEGLSRIAFYCPIALSIKRQTPFNAFVYKDHITIYKRPYPFYKGRYNLPEEAQKFIKRFDNKEYVKPFTFSLDI